MNAQEQIEVFKEFFEKFYYSDLLEIFRKKQSFIIVDFAKLMIYSPELSEMLLEQPEEVIAAAEHAVKEKGENVPDDFFVRFHSLPESQKMLIRNIRSKHIRKLYWFMGVVRNKSEVRPEVSEMRYECPACGNVISIIQLEKKLKEPSMCSCGRKGKFKVLSKKLIDAQALILEEASEDLSGSEQPKRLNVLVKNDLVSPINEKRAAPGTKIIVIGWPIEVPKELRSGAKSVKFDLVIDANNVVPCQDDIDDLKITPEEEAEIDKIAKDPFVYEKLVKNVAPSIYGHNEIKESLIVQLVGGVRKQRPDGVVTRGDIHVMLMGDPGCGKSQLLKRIYGVAPKARYVTGKGASLDYEEPILIKENDMIKNVFIGKLVESNCKKNIENKFLPFKNNIQTLAFNPKTLKLEWKKIKFGYRHKSRKKLFHLFLESGRNIKVTGDHSIFVLRNGKISSISASKLKLNETILIPSKIPNKEICPMPEGIATLLGYYIAEGHIRCKDASYKIEFTLNKNEINIFNKINSISKKLFNKEAKKYAHGKGGMRVIIYGKRAHDELKTYLRDTYRKKAKKKRVPQIIFNACKKDKLDFIKSYLEGDAGVTKSKILISDILYLFLEMNKIASFSEREDNKITKILNRFIKSTGNRYDLKTFLGKKYSHRYSRIPLEAIDKELFKKYCNKLKYNDYKRFNWNKLSNKYLIDKLIFVGDKKEVSGPLIRRKFNVDSLEYFINNDLYNIKKKGRTNYYSLTKKGIILYKKLKYLKKITNSDFGFVRLKKIKRVNSSSDYVYDVSVPGYENFVGGVGGIICHNSGAGLTAAVVKDEFLGGWSLEAGALVLANKGFVMIDELDKMDKEDQSAMHEGMEQQTVSISKANIQATLKCETTILAAANPKFGRFDAYEPIIKQVNLPPTLVNRFDLIFVIKDMPDQEKDRRLAQFILERHQTPELSEPEIPTDLFRKFISRVRKETPTLSAQALEELRDYYVRMRSMGKGEDGQVKNIPITARQLEALIRMSESSAKIRKSPFVETEDAQRAIRLLEFCLSQVAKDSETGKIDIDVLSSGTSGSQRGRINIVKEIILGMTKEGHKEIEVKEITKIAEAKGLNEDDVNEVLEKLKRSGDVYEPKRGKIQKL